MIVYRVFLRKWNDKTLFSAVVESDAALEYPVGKWTSAPENLAKKGYHPTCFIHLGEAKDFLNNFFVRERFEIWECEVEDVFVPKVKRVYGPFVYNFIIEDNSLIFRWSSLR